MIINYSLSRVISQFGNNSVISSMTIEIPKELFTDLKSKKINRDQFILLSYQHITGDLPNWKVATKQMGISNGGYYRAINSISQNGNSTKSGK